MVLQELHEGHPDFRRMKELARMYVWWTEINRDTEEYVCTIFSSALTTCHTEYTSEHTPRYWFSLDYAGHVVGRVPVPHPD